MPVTSNRIHEARPRVRIRSDAHFLVFYLNCAMGPSANGAFRSGVGRYPSVMEVTVIGSNPVGNLSCGF